MRNVKNHLKEETYKVAGRPVTLIKGKKSNGTDWKVKFQNGKETSLSDVLSLIKPHPPISVNENLSKEEKQVERFVKKLAKEFGYSMKDAVRFIQNTISKMGLKETVNENIFDAAKRFSDAFFDGLKANATNKAIEAAKKNPQFPSKLVQQMTELEKLAKELKADLEKYS